MHCMKNTQNAILPIILKIPRMHFINSTQNAILPMMQKIPRIPKIPRMHYIWMQMWQNSKRSSHFNKKFHHDCHNCRNQYISKISLNNFPHQCWWFLKGSKVDKLLHGPKSGKSDLNLFQISSKFFVQILRVVKSSIEPPKYRNMKHRFDIKLDTTHE